MNLLYPVQTVALASVLLAATRYKYKTPLQQETAAGSSFDFNFEGCFNLYKVRYQRREKRMMGLTAEEEQQLRETFDGLHWLKKIDERVDHMDLQACIQSMTELYQERAQAGLSVIE